MRRDTCSTGQLAAVSSACLQAGSAALDCGACLVVVAEMVVRLRKRWRDCEASGSPRV